MIAGVVGALLAFRSVDVCDDVVSDSGTVVQACRHLELDDPPVVAVGLLVLAALGAFFGEISGLGFTLRRDVREARNVAAAASRQANRAAGAAESAEQTAELAESLSQRVRTSPTAGRDDVAQRIESLAREYNEARDKMPAGTDRTREMTAIVSQMIAVLSGVSPDEFDVSTRLRSSDRGQRLAAYAYLYASPDSLRTQELVDAVLKEDKPFGQYWGLRALSGLVEDSPASLDRNSARELERLQRRVGSDTDRRHEVNEILKRWNAPGVQ